MIRTLAFVTLCGCSTSPTVDGGADAAPSDASATTGCFAVSAQTCNFSSTTCTTSDCDASLGACPAGNLYGCCVTTGACGPVSATCYYDVDAGLPAAQACEYAGYNGAPVVWQTALP